MTDVVAADAGRWVAFRVQLLLAGVLDAQWDFFASFGRAAGALSELTGKADSDSKIERVKASAFWSLLDIFDSIPRAPAHFVAVRIGVRCVWADL